ncbi:MAG: hypothetical protein K2N14_01340 [Clostridia bacterium]|nr:hypothetical protein [Clostridia bacterium]
MPKNFKIKKRKKTKTWLRKTLLCIMLPSYIALLIAIGVILFTMMLCGAEQKTVEIAVYICIAVMLMVSFGILDLIPHFRAKQAKIDLSNYDFNPYTPTDGEEVFEYVVPLEKYVFTAEPFDEDSDVELDSDDALTTYLSQYNPNNLLEMEQLGSVGSFAPFFTLYMNDNGESRSPVMIANKRVKGSLTEFTISYKYSAVFSEEGLTLNDEFFPYDKVAAQVDAYFFEFAVSARVIVICGDKCIASFAVGTKIAAVLKKYGISIDNPEMLEYILNDPDRAFRQIGLQGKLRKLK